MNRGRKLEPLVLKDEVHIKTKMYLKRCRLLLSADHPVFGASPDGISSTHVIKTLRKTKMWRLSPYPMMKNMLSV
jgi:hypothetical protein